MLKKWENLPKEMQTYEVKKYYEILDNKRFQLLLKRVFDICISTFLLIILLFPMIIISVMIIIDSPGPIFFKQERVTKYGRKFKIHKFRTMIKDADKKGNGVTIKDDQRITRIGSTLRKYRLDEFPQLIDVFVGNMSFVGTRPESTKYVSYYNNEMLATFLLPAGITSLASINFRNESNLLENVDNVDEVYINEILPQKMIYNLESIKRFSLLNEIKILIQTVLVIVGLND